MSIYDKLFTINLILMGTILIFLRVTMEPRYPWSDGEWYDFPVAFWFFGTLFSIPTYLIFKVVT